MEIVASFLGGLGLFLAGVKGLGSQLQAMAGRRLRLALGHLTRGGIGAAATGTTLGALTQSSNAVTVIAASLVQAGSIPLVRAIPLVAWANLGTAALVLAAALDLRLAALWLLGGAGCALALGPEKSRWRALLATAFQLGMVFLGLGILKSGAGPLRDTGLVADAMAMAGPGLALPFLLGAVVTLPAQSSSIVTIIAIALGQAGVLGGAQAGMVVCGASLGSGLSVLLVSGGLRGPARRLATFQVLFKAAGAVLLALPFLLASHGAHLPDAAQDVLSPWADQWATVTLSQRLGLLFVALQLVPALLIAPFHALIPALLERLSPATVEEELSRPRYLYDGALDHAPTALDLAAREQARLFGMLPALLDGVRDDAGEAPLPPAALASAGAALERTIDAFLQDILARGCPREELERALALENMNGLLASIRETVSESAAALAAMARRGAGDPVADLVPPLAESLHLLLSELHEAAVTGIPADAATVSELAADRSAMMDGLRRRTGRAGTAAQDGLDLLYRATSLFERAVWLIRRSALLLPRLEPEPSAAPVAEGTPRLAIGE